MNGVQVLSQIVTGAGTINFPSGASIRVELTDLDGNCSNISIKENGIDIDQETWTSGYDNTFNNFDIKETYTVIAEINEGACGE